MYHLYVKYGRRWDRVAADHNVRPLVTYVTNHHPDRSYKVESQAGTAIILHTIAPLGEAIFRNSEAR